MITSYYTAEERYRIANTIWVQLGSQRFSIVTGTKPECYGEKDGKVFLLMTVAGNKKGIGLFEVSDDEGKDLYEVSFMCKKDGQTSVVANYSEVYFDMLPTLFEQHTGISVNFKDAA